MYVKPPSKAPSVKVKKGESTVIVSVDTLKAVIVLCSPVSFIVIVWFVKTDEFVIPATVESVRVKVLALNTSIFVKLAPRVAIFA